MQLDLVLCKLLLRTGYQCIFKEITLSELVVCLQGTIARLDHGKKYIIIETSVMIRDLMCIQICMYVHGDNS